MEDEAEGLKDNREEFHLPYLFHSQWLGWRLWFIGSIAVVKCAGLFPKLQGYQRNQTKDLVGWVAPDEIGPGRGSQRLRLSSGKRSTLVSSLRLGSSSIKEDKVLQSKGYLARLSIESRENAGQVWYAIKKWLSAWAWLRSLCCSPLVLVLKNPH